MPRKIKVKNSSGEAVEKPIKVKAVKKNEGMKVRSVLKSKLASRRSKNKDKSVDEELSIKVEVDEKKKGMKIPSVLKSKLVPRRSKRKEVKDVDEKLSINVEVDEKNKGMNIGSVLKSKLVPRRSKRKDKSVDEKPSIKVEANENNEGMDVLPVLKSRPAARRIKKKSKSVDEKPSIKDEVDEKKGDMEVVAVVKTEPASRQVRKKGKKNSKEWRYFKRSGKSKKKCERRERGVVYVSSLPHGFYEKQLEGYFGQFGKVTGVYVPKSKKTGRAKGFAFVEFLHAEVAKIAAETMNNYLMFNRLIKTELVPPEKHRPAMFSDRYKKIKAQNTPAKVKLKLAKRRKLIRDTSDSFVKRAVSKVVKLQESLSTLGVDYKIKVAGLQEGVTLTSHKTIDPDES